jgi:hypothetical protein
MNVVRYEIKKYFTVYQAFVSILKIVYFKFRNFKGSTSV